MPDRDTVGDLAIVLHSHMPYVEGFGTYPFGEEWLFDAVVRSYLPLLDFVRDVTMTVTPVLADQLEDEATSERLHEFLIRHRIEAAEKDAEEVDPAFRPAAEAEATRFRGALRQLEECDFNPLAAFQRAEAEGRIAVAASTASHSVLPLVATRAGRRLQIDAGLRSHRRRFERWQGGFWLPECGYEPGLEHLLNEYAINWFCTDQSAHEDPLDALHPVRTGRPRLPEGSGPSGTGPSRSGPIAFTIDWEAIQWLWSLDGYPSHAAHARFDAKSLRGTRFTRIGGGAYDPEEAATAARGQAAEFAAAIAGRLQAFHESRGVPGLIVFAVDTELLGHWWSEGPIWLEEALRRLPEAGVRLVTLDQAAAEAPSTREVELQASTWGEGKDFRTWDGRLVHDLCQGNRRLELRLLHALDRGLDGQRAQRAARELLAVQASDWAFLDARAQAGDYPFERATQHAENLLEAIDCTSAPSPDARLRAFAPDMSLAPLLEP